MYVLQINKRTSVPYRRLVNEKTEFPLLYYALKFQQTSARGHLEIREVRAPDVRVPGIKNPDVEILELGVGGCIKLRTEILMCQTK